MESDPAITAIVGQMMEVWERLKTYLTPKEVQFVEKAIIDFSKLEKKKPRKTPKQVCEFEREGFKCSRAGGFELDVEGITKHYCKTHLTIVEDLLTRPT